MKKNYSVILFVIVLVSCSGRRAVKPELAGVALRGGGEQPGTISCATGSPAIAVPSSRANVTLWPANGFQPSDLGRLPRERDSTAYQGDPSQLPGKDSGLELFTDLDIGGNFAYVSYNSGFAIWDIDGAFAATPKRRGLRDGWKRGHFCEFEPLPTETDEIVWDIDYIADGSDELIALASSSTNVGLTLWDVSNKDLPMQLYQDKSKRGRRVDTVRFNNKSLAFYGVLDIQGTGGLHVYDMTEAKSCLATSSNGCGSDCSAVYLGEIADWRETGYVSTLNRNGRLFVAVSDDGATFSLGVEIREVTNVRPFGLLASRAVFSGLDSRSRGVSLFEYKNKAYLAVKEPSELKIFDITACLDSNNCTTLKQDNPVWSDNITGAGSKRELVSFSQVDSENAYLYLGNDNSCPRGTKREHLLQLKNLGTGKPLAITAGSGIYTDPDHGGSIDYWGTYYDGNTNGFNAMQPRVVKARREPSNSMIYFYRAAWSIFDVHQQESSMLFSDGFESGKTSAWSKW